MLKLIFKLKGLAHEFYSEFNNRVVTKTDFKTWCFNYTALLLATYLLLTCCRTKNKLEKCKSAHHELWSAALKKRQQQSFCIIHQSRFLFFQGSKGKMDYLLHSKVFFVSFQQNRKSIIIIIIIYDLSAICQEG